MARRAPAQGAGWFKSSYSNPSQECVEVRPDRDAMMLRDSKNPDGPVFILGFAQWSAFLDTVKRSHPHR